MRNRQTLQWIFLVASCALFFQNCGKFQTTDLSSGNPGGSLLVNAGVKPSQASVDKSVDGSNIVPSNAFRVSPTALDFSLNQDHYRYRLIFESGAVISLEDGGSVILTLTIDQLQKLNSIIDVSVVASTLDFALNADHVCSQEIVPPYASVHTDYGPFDLGGGTSGCVIDLYKNDSSASLAGLKDLLTEVEKSLGPQAVVEPNAGNI